MTAPRRITEVAGRRSGWIETGPRDAPPVLLLHGGGFDHAGLTWAPVTDRLRSRFRLIVPDLPGYGESAGLGRAHDLGDLGRWVVAFKEAVDLPRAHVAGVSMGGGMALWLAIHAPERVARLVPVAAYGTMARLPLHGIARRLGPLGAMRLAYGLASESRVLARIGLAGAYADPSRIDDDTLDALMAVAREQRGRRSFEEFLTGEVTAEGLRGNLTADLHRIAAPTLMIHGRADLIVPIRHARAAVRAIPGARLHEMETGHWPMRERPEAFCAVLEDFLTES